MGSFPAFESKDEDLSPDQGNIQNQETDLQNASFSGRETESSNPFFGAKNSEANTTDVSVLYDANRQSHSAADIEDILDAVHGLARLAREHGLDFYRTKFVMVTPEEISDIAAMEGFMERYPHWHWGMDAEKQKFNYKTGQGKIFELVINNDPAVAYLVTSNTLMEQLLVIAHVYAHVDFFKNNPAFAPTNRDMVETMASHARYIRGYVEKYGEEKVEEFIDDVLALTDLIEPLREFVKFPFGLKTDSEPEEPHESKLKLDDHLEAILRSTNKQVPKNDKTEEIPYLDGEVHPTRDVLRLVGKFSDNLEPWQENILHMLIEETEYFVPQMQTKIMNEGWATFWHHRILIDSDVLQRQDTSAFALLNAGVLSMPPGSFNPYYVGYKLFLHIEEKYGLEECFRARASYNDIGFINKYLDKEFIDKEKLYSFAYDDWTERNEIESRDVKIVKARLTQMLINSGKPRIYAVAINHKNSGALLLEHKSDEIEPPELDMKKANLAIQSLASLWGKDVYLRCKIEDKPGTLVCKINKKGKDKVTYETYVTTPDKE